MLHKRHDETTHITPYTDNNKTPRLTPVHHTPPHTTPRHTTHRTITHGSIPLHTTPHHTTPNRVARRVVLYIVSKGSIYRYVSHGIFDISYRTRCALHALASPLCCLLLYRYYTERKRPYTVSNIEMVSISFLSVSVSYRTRFRHRYLTLQQTQKTTHNSFNCCLLIVRILRSISYGLTYRVSPIRVYERQISMAEELTAYRIPDPTFC